MNIILKEISNFFAWRDLPVRADALVLDVGSGDNPHIRADVLCDAHLLDRGERCGKFDLVIDGRPFVFADAVNLPFKDKAFDFVVCRHLLEHMEDPLPLLRELERVGRAGYIETPSALMEKLCGWSFHKLLIEKKEGALFIKAKPAGENFGILPQEILKGPDWDEFVEKNKKSLIVSYFWKEIIRYSTERVFKENIKEEPESFSVLPVRSAGRRLRWRLTKFIRLFISRPKFKIDDLLVCPKCHKGLEVKAENTFCSFCNIPYSVLERTFYKFI